MENLGAGGGFGPLLNGFGLGGESADMPRERGGGLFQNTLGEQIFRELRAGGVLTATGGFAAGDFAGQGAADSGNSSFGGERQAGADTLMQSLNGVEQRRGEETSLGRAEFGSLLAAAQGGSTPALEGLARGSTPQYSVQHQVGQDGFTPAVGERIDWMLKGGVKEARLQLNPPGMGPLDVMVTVGEERTTVNMVAHNTATREALQEDLQRLRNMLADQGNGEVEVNVSSGGEDDKQDGAVGLAGQETAGGGGQGDSPDGEGDELLERGADNPVKGLIDHFA
jgi:flagellar hook-length control protein FliK